MGAKHFFSHSLDARKRSPASREHHSIAQLRVKALVANTVVNLFENILNFDVCLLYTSELPTNSLV